MKPTFKIALAILIACVFILSACKKDNTESTPPPTEDVPLTDDQAAFLETVKDTFIPLQNIILENGQSVRYFLDSTEPSFLQNFPSAKTNSTASMPPQQQRITFYARMFGMANYLVDHSNHVHPAEGPHSPAQTRLGYSWGSKDYSKRQPPPTVRANGCNDDSIYGLDCTGFLYNLIHTANLPIASGQFWINNISNTKIWTDAFKASADYKDLVMVDSGKLPENRMKNGDIILWSGHVGVFLYGFIYQSNGNADKPACGGNLGTGSGPRFISVAEIISWPGMGNYKVFRTTNLGEDYTLSFVLDYSGASGSGNCGLVNYLDSVVVSITVSPEDSVTVNYIRNYTPAIHFESLQSCTCLGMSFITGSPFECTDFKAHMLPIAGIIVLEYTMTANYCWSTDYYKCGTFPADSLAGQVNYGYVEAEAGCTLPVDPGTSLTDHCSVGNGGMLTVTHER